MLWWANLLDTDRRCCYVSSVSTSVCILWSGWLVSSTPSSFVDYTFTLISAYKTLTLCFCVCLCLSVVFPNCSQNLQPQGNDDHSFERFSLFSTHVQGATLSSSLKIWAMGSGSVQHCINSLCVNILLIGPYPQPSVQAEQRALILCHCPLITHSTY